MRETQPVSVSNDVDGETVKETARAVGVCPAMIWSALSPDPSKRRGLPFLPSFKVGRRRLVRPAARRAWVQALEAAQVAEAERDQRAFDETGARAA